MAESTPPRPLKANPNRSVYLENSGDGTERVVKRYRARGWLRRLGDRSRARREFEMLRALHARGVSVPEPLELRRRAGAWELVCERIPGAATLAELLERPSDAAVAATEVARRLGALLARAHEAGTDHADLHAGNLLVDRSGSPWLIDFAHARLRESPARQHLVRDVTNLAADSRERTSPATRSRFFAAWWRGLSKRSRALLSPRAELAERIERDARRHRRDAVRRHAGSWLRGYDRCRELEAAEIRGLIRREVPASEEPAIVAAVRSRRGVPAVIRHPLDASRELLVIEGTEALRTVWCELGRAFEHALPALLPLAWLEGPPTRAAFELPAGSVRWGEARRRTAIDEPVARGLGALHGALHDRGLSATAPEWWWRGPGGAVMLGPGCALLDATTSLPPFPAEIPRRGALEAAYAAAFLAAQRGPEAYRIALARSLTGA